MGIPQVSVIIPTCNRPGLLPTAIRSVLGQTFSDFELVIVDDASEESIDDIVEAYHDKRVRCIRHERKRGGAAARNTGIRSSNGEFVAFLDDDDEWYPEKLARQTTILLRNADIGVIYTGYDVIIKDTGKLHLRKVPKHRGDLSSTLLQGNCVGTTSSVLLRRDCFRAVGMFDESLPAFQDYDLWIRLSKVYRFDYIRDILLTYYAHSNKIWTNPEAIQQGIRILLQKYGGSGSFRRQSSVYYLTAAAGFCEAGKGRKARAALRQAISLYPFDARYYFYFFLSLESTEVSEHSAIQSEDLGNLAGASRTASKRQKR